MPYSIFIVVAVVGVACGAAALHYNGINVSLKAVATEIGWGAAIVTGLGVLWQKALRPFFFHVRHVNNLLTDVGEIVRQHRELDFAKLVESVNAINHDLRPNSGLSMRDAIDRIEAKVSLVDRVNWAIRQDGPVGIFRCDQEGRNIEVNRTYCRWIGVGTDELLGHGWRRFLAGTSSREDYDEEWKVAFDEGREIEFRIDLRTVAGAVRQFDVHAYPIHTTGGKLTEYLGVLRPVEEVT